MLLRPRLFLDTDVCISVANGAIDPAEWNRVEKHINSKYRYSISYITLKELCVKVSRGSPAYFQKNKKPLQVLNGRSKREYLPYPVLFALRRVLPRRSVLVNGQAKNSQLCEKLLELVLAAPSKAELNSPGVPDPKQSSLRTWLDLDSLDEDEGEPQQKHVELLDGIRGGRIDPPDRLKMAEALLLDSGLTPYPGDCDKLAESLDAAFRYSMFLGNLAKNNTYDFQKHESDWGDTLQLFYFCDERMHILTRDGDFADRTKGTNQAAQILMYDHFAKTC